MKLFIWVPKCILSYPYNSSLPVGYLNHGNWISDASTIDLLHPCRQFLDTMEILKQFVFLYALLAIYKSYKNYRRKCSRNIPDVRVPKMTTVFKHLKRIRARDSILERKRAPRRQALPQKKLEKLALDWRNPQDSLWFDLHSWRVCLQHRDELE